MSRCSTPQGSQVQEGAARVDGTTVEVDLAPDLPDGTYVISYRVVSADGHPVRGASVFGVGPDAIDESALGAATASEDDRVWEVSGAVGRGLAYAGVLLAAGGVAFLVLVHRGGAERTQLRQVVWGAALVGAAASMIALPVQAALGTGQGPSSLFDDGVLAEVAQDGLGLGIVLALAGLVVAVSLVERQPAVALAGAVVAAGSFATNGHTRAGSSVALATISDVTHLLAAAAWGGGLVLLALCLRARRRAEVPTTDTVTLVGRYSTLATITIVLVGLSGAALAWFEVGSLGAFTSTGYGRLLLVKIAVVAVIAALGAYNHFRLVPALTRGKAKASLAQLRTTLTDRDPCAGRRRCAHERAGRGDAGARGLGGRGGRGDRDAGRRRKRAADRSPPAEAGFNQIHLYTFDPEGRPADIAETVTLELTLPAAQLGPLTARRRGPVPPTSSSTAPTSPSAAPGPSRCGPASTASPRRPARSRCPIAG